MGRMLADRVVGGVDCGGLSRPMRARETRWSPWWSPAGRMVECWDPAGKRVRVLSRCNSSMLTGQCGMNWAGHSGSKDLGVDGPQRQRQRGTGVGEGTIGPKASVNFLNSSGPDLLRRLHGPLTNWTTFLSCNVTTVEPHDTLITTRCASTSRAEKEWHPGREHIQHGFQVSEGDCLAGDADLAAATRATADARHRQGPATVARGV